MKSCFPFFVCHVTLPLDKVDVNVHPNKLDVKFEDQNKIFGIVYITTMSLGKEYFQNEQKKIGCAISCSSHARSSDADNSMWKRGTAR